MKKNKKIVCLGGGNAMPKAVLTGLKKYPVKISVISAMLDSGGGAGKEREQYQTGVSFGDFRRAALALSEIKEKDKKRFAYRYESGPLAGHVVANLYCSLSVFGNNNIEKSFNNLIDDINDDLKIPSDYKIFPATLVNSSLGVELENGRIILGESNVDIPKHDPRLKIKKAFLLPKAEAYPKAIKEIKKADLIVIGPGDLYSSLSQVLLTNGLAATIKKSKAKKVYICNIMTKRGETEEFLVADFSSEIEKILGLSIDYVIYNTAVPQKEILDKYKKIHQELISLVGINNNLPKNKFIGRSILKRGTLEHDTKKVCKVLTSLI